MHKNLKTKEILCCDENVDFNKLLASERPHYLITDELWDQWVLTLQESSVRFNKIIDIAASLNLHWPETKRDQEVSCYLNWSLIDLFEISDVYIKKTLFLCIAEAAINRIKVFGNDVDIPDTGNSAEVYIGNEIVLELSKLEDSLIWSHFKEHKDPYLLLSSYMWTEWSSIVKKGKYATVNISTMAKLLNLNTVAIKEYDETLSFYTSHTLNEILSLNVTFKNIMILCVAAVAIIESEKVSAESIIPINSIVMSPEIDQQTNIDTVKENAYISDVERLYCEGMSAISVARILSKPPISVYKTLIHLKLIRNRTSSGYNLSKIPTCLREKLKHDGINFGIWCSFLNLSPAIVEKAICSLVNDGQIPGVARKAISSLREDYPEVYFQITNESKEITNDVGINKIYNNTETDVRIKENEFTVNMERLLKQMKLDVKPETFVTEEMWNDWYDLLVNKSFANELIINVARRNGLIWPISKNDEIFKDYLSQPFSKIKKVIGWDTKRTLIICVAQAAFQTLTIKESFREESEKPPEPFEKIVEKKSEILFADIQNAENPIDLLDNEKWETWTSLLKNHPASQEYIADLVDEIGGLYWQRRWSGEKIQYYLDVSLDQFSKIKLPEKNRTIIICIAYCYFNKNNSYAEAKIVSRPINITHSYEVKNKEKPADKSLHKHIEQTKPEPKTESKDTVKNKLLDTIFKDFF